MVYHQGDWEEGDVPTIFIGGALSVSLTSCRTRTGVFSAFRVANVSFDWQRTRGE